MSLKERRRRCWDVIVEMKTRAGLSLEQIRAMLAASEEVEFKGKNRAEVYAWVDQTLRRVRYQDLVRSARGLVRKYVAKMTGLRRAQVTRLIGLYLNGEPVKPKPYRRNRFRRKYTRADVDLLASVDEAHQTLSGPGTQQILRREFQEFGKKEYERLSKVSVAQLYRMRHTQSYRQRLVKYQPTRPSKISIGERRKPRPKGRPGYLRVDTVHQGDLDGVKGVYHITAVDEVTQWVVLGSVPQISEAYLLPVL